MESITYKEFFKGVLDGTITLSNDRDGNTFCSWKAGGQDFYAFGVKKEVVS